MNEISCDICMDLMPLVRDGLASDASRNAVLAHTRHCEACRSFFEESSEPIPDLTKSVDRIRARIRFFSAMLLMFGIFFGLSLTGGSNLFYNILIMPVIGALGYYIFRWIAAIAIPIVLFVIHSITNLMQIFHSTEYLDMPSLILWTLLYSFFALLGVIIAGLIHFAFRKEQ